MRVIAGELKGQRLVAPRGWKVRPTSDRVREAIFSALGDVEGANVLDLYCGTGALAIEALSRGAATAMLVDQDTRPALGNVTGGYSGPPIKPVALRVVHEVTRALPDVPVIGTGGVASGTDAVEMLPSLGRINFARVHDIIGRNQLIVDQTADVRRPLDISRDLMDTGVVPDGFFETRTLRTG